MAGQRVVLCTFGSLGDLYPFVALGCELKRRGHFPVIACTAAYRARVEAAGVEFHPVRPAVDVSDPELLRRAMHPRDGTRYIACELVLPYVRESYEDTAAIARDADLLVTHPVTLSAFLFARKTGMRWASVAVAPVSMLSAYDPCVYPGIPFAEWLAARGPRFQRSALRVFEWAYEPYWKPFRDFEKELGLPRSRNPILFGHSPQLALALFSPLLAAPQPDWPPHSHTTGFPFFQHDEGNSPELQQFLDSGEPPLVFTLGSAAVGAAGDFFEQSVKAAQSLGRRALLLIGQHSANQLPELPPGVMAVPYAPHAAVFPRSCVNIHQGGIGTTGEAMRAGRPMLVVPFSHDQPDHAYRLKKLGVARSLSRAKYTADTAAREIKALLENPEYARNAAAVGARVRAEAGTQAACDLLENLLASVRTKHAAFAMP